MKSATAFLPMSSASLRSLAMPGLARAQKDKKYSSLSSKLELKGLLKSETASSTRSTLHLSRLDISFQCRTSINFSLIKFLNSLTDLKSITAIQILRITLVLFGNTYNS